MAALPPEVGDALKLFDPAGREEFPTFRGAVTCNVRRPIGPGGKFTFDTDIRLADAAGSLVGFPYPLSGLTGELKVRDGYVDVIGVKAKRGDATLVADGRVAWATDSEQATAPTTTPTDATTRPAVAAADRPRTDLRITARNLPLDDALLAALPEEPRAWVRRTGVRGRLDVDGRLAPPKRRPSPAPTTGPSPTTAPAPAPSLDFDLNIALRDGSARPEDGKFEITDLTGRMHLTPDGLELTGVRGRRGDGEISGGGTVAWAGGKATLALALSARNLLAEPALYALLPVDAKKAWDEVQPVGTADADVTYAGSPSDDAKAAPVVAIDLTREPAPTTLPTTLPTTGPASILPGLRGRSARATFRSRSRASRTGWTSSRVRSTSPPASSH